MSAHARVCPPGLRRRLAEERGMTIVEAVVAALVLVIATLGVLQVVDASTRNTYRAEQSQVVVNRLQAELEDVRQLTYGQVALTTLPTSSSDPANPNSRVVDGQFNLRRDGADWAPLVYQGSALEEGGQVGDTVDAAVEHGPVPFESGDVTGQIYRYVVWIDDEDCGLYCPGTQDLKRVVVVAALDDTASGGTRAYQELHTDIVDPDTAPTDNPAPPGEDNQTRPATFWLTDTPCAESERQPIVEDHPTHNTHGACSAGMKTGSTSGAPDLMFTEQPPEDPDVPEQPLFDYSTDVGSGPGLRMRPPLTNGCLLPSLLDVLEPDKQTKFHAWLSQPMPSGFELALSGAATLNLWTRRVEEIPHSGRICVWLFKRHLNVLQQPVDTFAVNLDPPLTNLAHFYGTPNPPSADWPQQWTEISVPMNFIALDVLEDERLGLAIAVEREDSQAQRLDFMYDHPDFVSRLEVRTTSVVGPLFGDD